MNEWDLYHELRADYYQNDTYPRWWQWRKRIWWQGVQEGLRAMAEHIEQHRLRQEDRAR